MPLRRVKPNRVTKKVRAVSGFGAPLPPPPPDTFPNRRSSGVFSAHKDARYMDWAVINGGSFPHWIRVTTYRCPVGAAKVVIAGPTLVYLNATFTGHEPVAIGGDNKSVYYEVVVEDEDLNMHPSVQLFRQYPTDAVPGWLITPGDFAQTQT